MFFDDDEYEKEYEELIPDMYQFAPRLDFTRNWTDDQLYARYNLSPRERDYIGLVVRDMNSK